MARRHGGAAIATVGRRCVVLYVGPASLKSAAKLPAAMIHAPAQGLGGTCGCQGVWVRASGCGLRSACSARSRHPRAPMMVARMMARYGVEAASDPTPTMSACAGRSGGRSVGSVGRLVTKQAGTCVLVTAGRHPTCSVPTDLLASYYLLHVLRTAHLLDEGAARLTKRSANDLDRGLGGLGLGLGLGLGSGLGLGLGFGSGPCVSHVHERILALLLRVEGDVRTPIPTLTPPSLPLHPHPYPYTYPYPDPCPAPLPPTSAPIGARTLPLLFCSWSSGMYAISLHGSERVPLT